MKYIKEFKESDIEPINSFKVHPNLNGEVWIDSDTIEESIQKELKEIADEFWKELDIDLELLDIYFTGSLATFSYSRYSDFDIHLVVDFQESKDPDIMKRYCDQFRFNWNKKHNILVKGFEVELYVQDKNEPHTANGLYSIMNSEWITIPVKKDFEPDTKMIRLKAESLMTEIDELEKDFENSENIETLESRSEVLWKKIATNRKSGLEKGGEFSMENLVFKFLRRNKYLEVLSDLKTKLYDKKYSLE